MAPWLPSAHRATLVERGRVLVLARKKETKNTFAISSANLAVEQSTRVPEGIRGEFANVFKLSSSTCPWIHENLSEILELLRNPRENALAEHQNKIFAVGVHVECCLLMSVS